MRPSEEDDGEFMGEGIQGRFAWGPRALRAWLLVAACIALIWTASGDSFSAHQTSRFLEPLLRWLFGELGPGTLWRVQVAIRKAAHVVEYAVLAVVAYRALRLSIRSTLLRHALLGLTLVTAVAVSDEARQAQLATRTGALGDVGLDLVGGILGIVLAASLAHSGRLGRWFPTPEPRSG